MSGAHNAITDFLFVEKAIPNFLFRYLDTCNQVEYTLIIKLLEGKSLRKILPSNLQISKVENRLLQLNNIVLPDDCEDYILERFIIAPKVLKEYPDRVDTLNKLLEASKLFRGNLPSFREDLIFWQDVFRFIVRNISDLSDPYTFSHTIDYFESQRYYCAQPLMYSIKGRTKVSVTRAIANCYVDFSYKPEYYHYECPPLPFDKWMQIAGKDSYSIEEITDGKRLSEESKTLHHCVFSYAESCLRGHTHIFSLSKIIHNTKKPFITIEVTKNRITQIAGKHNSLPSNAA